MKKQILRVGLDVPLNRLFDYANDSFKAQVGARVAVSFAGRTLVGVIVEITETTDVAENKLKQVLDVFDDVVFDANMFKLLNFCANYYHYPLGQAMIAALPLRLRQIKPAKTRKRYIYALSRPMDIKSLPKRQAVLQRIVQALQDGASSKPSLSEAQLAEISSGWRKAIATLKEMGCLQQTEVVSVKAGLQTANVEPTLNAEQQQVIQSVLSEANHFKPWLLYGITGSGKTEVYIQLLKVVLAEKDAQALILVPEINLTPQLESRFRSRLSEYPLVTLHSSLSESERLQSWQSSNAGEAKIIIGTRLSVFSAMPKLKMILIDEEHDSSYKQQDGMRYHARDVAIMRAKQLDIPIVMGSATPSLETWHLAKKQQYGLLRLKKRAVESAKLPKIHCIDTGKSPTEKGLSPILIREMRERIKRGEQSLLFLNRRGYAPVLHCSACQWVAPCVRCSTRLVVHLGQKQLKCHHCGHEQRIPMQCPDCGNPDLSPVGQATQRLEQTLIDLFPTANITRVDSDSVRNKDALTDLLKKVHDREVDILVGTQMLAKGHDFPHLTLVGVIDTDTALFSPDFRASERLFSQLMQVSGRAGRAEKPGEVLIQTTFPQHALFDALRAQDYEVYADTLLDERKAMQFPPTSYFALLRAESSTYNQVLAFLNESVALAQQISSDVMVYDPLRPQVERLNNMERGQLLLQASSRVAFHQFLRQWMPQLRAQKLANKIRWVLDIDPIEF
ncbi:MAG: primosomal protein N' (replication factor Y) [Methylophilaceae bacterium]|jgi:primosomal protein N' (replication factor Y)